MIKSDKMDNTRILWYGILVAVVLVCGDLLYQLGFSNGVHNTNQVLALSANQIYQRGYGYATNTLITQLNYGNGTLFTYGLQGFINNDCKTLTSDNKTGIYNISCSLYDNTYPPINLTCTVIPNAYGGNYDGQCVANEANVTYQLQFKQVK